MKNLVNLSKIYLKQLLSQTFNSKRKQSKANVFLMMLFISLFVCFGLGYSFYSLGKTFYDANRPQMVLLVGLIASSIFVLFFTVYQQQGVYFKAKDYDFLASLPIKTHTVVFAKFISSYVLSLFYNFLFSLPIFIVYFIFNGISIVGIIYALLSLFLTPSFIVLIGNILTILISLITYKLKNNNIISSVLTLVFVLIIFAFVFMGSNESLLNAFSSNEVSIWIKVLLPNIPFLFYAVTTGSFLQFFWFFLISVSSIGISVLILSLLYKKINNFVLGTGVKHKRKNTKILYKPNKLYLTLIKKEVKTILNSPVYFVNCVMGAILTVVFGILFGVMFKGGEVEMVSIAVAIFSLCNAFAVGVAPPSAISINVEGENLYILKSLPIKFKDIAFSKLSFSILVYLPFILISNILFFSIIQPQDAMLIIISIILQLVGLVVVNIVGLLINLKFPKINWLNMTQAVKQSMSVFIMVIVDFAICLIPLILGIGFIDKIMQAIPLSLFLTICAIFYFLIGVIATILLAKNGEKLYDRI